MTERRRDRGQIIPFFALAIVAILAMAALVYDGANSLVNRRQLQNAGDAAALAGSNLIQAAGSSRTCSLTAGPPPGPPRADIVAAVQASIAANLPGYPLDEVQISCPEGWSNQAVGVNLLRASASWFAGAIGAGTMEAATTSVALNGRIASAKHSVVLLDTHNPTWPTGRRGCPAFQIGGGPTITFDGSVVINSACPTGSGGALAAGGASATVTLNNDAVINIVGGYVPGNVTIAPPPSTGAAPILDPLRDFEPPNLAAMTVRSASPLLINGTTQVLEPGIYRGGIELRSSAVALLRPGIYVLDGVTGNNPALGLGAQSSVCSISATSTATSCADWAANCSGEDCGVLIFNRGTAAVNGTKMGPIAVGAGATLKLRAYDERAVGDAYPEYRNLLIWQDGNPPPTSTFAQPEIALGGGGDVDISGTVYAPGAKVYMVGNSGGSGGNPVNVLIQFIVWDLHIQGNAAFHFYYSSDDFARPTDYGLVR